VVSVAVDEPKKVAQFTKEKQYITIGASEMSCAVYLAEKSKTIPGVEQWPYHAAGLALEVIPRTLIQNCGADAVRVLTQLRVSSNETTD